MCGLYTIFVALCQAPLLITQIPNPYFIYVWTFKKSFHIHGTTLYIIDVYGVWLEDLSCFQMVCSLMKVVYWFHQRAQIIS